MSRRKCCVCSKYLTEENQYINKKKWYICKKCANEYFRKRQSKKYNLQKNILRNLKINGCAICGYSKCNAALDFHHVNPWNRKFSINTANLYHKNDDFIDEFHKCILLCKNCHTEIHDKARKILLKRQGYIKELN